MNNVLVTGTQLNAGLVAYYKSQFLRELYKIVLSAEVLGNPAGIASAFGAGVRDFIMEPVSGFKLGAQGFGRGLGKGTASLLLNTLKGFSMFASGIAGRFGDGVARMSFDESFIRGRIVRDSRFQPVHVGDEVVLGSRALAQNVVQAVAGVCLCYLDS